MDWVVRYKSVDPSLIKVKYILATVPSLPKNIKIIFKVFVLDEADVMIDTQGHKDQTIRIHRTLDKEKCQFLFFSATYDDEVMKFAEKIIPHPNTIKLKREEETLSNIKQYQVRFKVINRKFLFFLEKSFD